MKKASENPLQAFLARLLLRSSLTADEQAAVLALRGHAVHVAAHHDIIAPGQTTGSACLVTEGLVARFDQMADGWRQFTSLYIAGDMCDLHSVVSPAAGWGLQAITVTTILRIRHADLNDLAIRHPAIAFAFWRDAVVDASVLAKWVSNVGRRDARSRLAHLFCELGLRMELAGVGLRTDFPMPMTQIHLADALGLTPVHVNRTLQTMRHDGLVVTENRRVRVGSWSDLTHVAEFDPQFLLLRGQSNPSTAKLVDAR